MSEFEHEIQLELFMMEETSEYARVSNCVGIEVIVMLIIPTEPYRPV